MTTFEPRPKGFRRSLGNLLGAPRAESDEKMLERAFLETADYRALTQTDAFNFVVGRRGTGKSALFRKVSEYFSKEPGTLLFQQSPSEDQTLYLRDRLENLGLDYNRARATMRLIWKGHLLLQAVEALNRFYKISKSSQAAALREFENRYKTFLSFSGTQRCVEILRHFAHGLPPDARQIMSRVGRGFGPAGAVAVALF